MLAVPSPFPVDLSLACIDSKEAQKKLKAGICFRIPSHNKHTWFLLSLKKHKLQVQEKKTSAINRAFFPGWAYGGWAYGLSLACFIQARACRLLFNPVLSKGVTAPLFDSMIVTQGEGSENPTEPHHTPSAQDEPTPQHDQTTSQEPQQQQETTIPSLSPSDILIHKRLTKWTIWFSQSKVPSPGADETACPSGDDRHGEALDAGQDMENIAKTSAMPHEASPRVTSLSGGEGSMQQQLTKLMDICTSLQRQHSLMAEKIQSQDLEIIQLKTRVKTLEDNEKKREGFAHEDAPNTRGIDQGEDLLQGDAENDSNKSTDKGS
ncbi:hypothetical protein Tco_1173368, partial [Tanacetum coccineum]